MIRRASWIAGGVLVAWIVVLFVLGFVLAGSTGSSVSGRLGDSLQANATLGDTSLALVRGRFELANLALRREDLIGQLELDVAEVTCELPPLGLALVDRECRDLIVGGVRMEVSAIALFRLHRPKRKPFRVQHVVVDNATLAFAPSAFVPSLGRIQIKIEHAEAGPTTFKTPLSFLFSVIELRASFDLPAGITIQLRYRDGVLAASGSLFGSTPIELPVKLPVLDSAEDAHAEIAKLIAFGRDLAERLVARRAEDWIEKKLSP